MSTTRRRMMSYKYDILEPEIDYLTIIPESEDGCSFEVIPVMIEFAEFFTACPFYYSIDNSEWIERNDISYINVPYGSSIRFKSNLKNFIEEFNNAQGEMYMGYWSFQIYSSNSYSAQGTPMSLIYEDEYQDYDSLIYLYNKYLSIGVGCFERMFGGGLLRINNPKTFLPATTLADYCYNGMFSGCASLQNAPELPATILADYCYNSMFYGCSNLNYIKMLATDISARYCLYNWVRGVASSGTFVKNSAMTSLPMSFNGIPYGWTVQNA